MVRKRGETSLEIPRESLVTPAARDRARELKVEIRRVEAPAAACPDAKVLVEEVVRRVLVELERRARHRSAPRPAALGTADDGTTRFPGRLLTSEGVRALGRGLRALALAKGTIVTPAALDELRAREIEVRRG